LDDDIVFLDVEISRRARISAVVGLLPVVGLGGSIGAVGAEPTPTQWSPG